MTQAEGSTPSRVVSRDGTEIAYFTSGEGPPLVVVHGGLTDHTRWQPLLPHLEPHVTVHALDRRGRGASGDQVDYALEREFEDVATLVDAVAEQSGRRVAVYGHSFGATCALGAATLTGNVSRLVLYEGPVDPAAQPLPVEFLDRIDTLLADDDYEAVVAAVYRQLAGMSDDELAIYRASPTWPARVASAPTFSRESRGLLAGPVDLDRAATVTVPTMLVVGGDSPESIRAENEALAEAMPDARIAVLEGQQHIADALDPQLFARQLLAFLHEPS